MEKSLMPVKESLINSEIPAKQGCVAIFDERSSLKMKESEFLAFHFPYSEKSRVDLFRAFLSLTYTRVRL